MPSRRRIPLVSLLEKLPKQSARLWLAFLAQDVIHSIKARKRSIARAEDVLFNLDVLLFCDRKLKDRDLQWIVEYGMELSDVEQLIGRDEVLNACKEIEKRLAKITLGQSIVTRKRSHFMGTATRKTHT